MNGVKKCTKCSISKSISEFYGHKMMGDGHLSACKECIKKAVSLHRSKNLERINAYDRERAQLPHRRAHSKRVIEKWILQFPERKRAQYLLGNALRDGRAIQWPICEMEGCERRPEAHHPDYSAPLAVTWLCPSHHKKLHAEHRKNDATNVCTSRAYPISLDGGIHQCELVNNRATG